MSETNEALRERAVKFLDYRLTGAEAVIAISIMADFAAQELAAQAAEVEQLKARLKEAEEVMSVALKHCNEVRNGLRGTGSISAVVVDNSFYLIEDAIERHRNIYSEGAR